MTVPAPYRSSVDSAAVMGHGGMASLTPMVLFAPPPSSIGPLRSAQSTLAAGALRLSRPVQAVAIAAGALVAAAVFVGVSRLLGYDSLFDLGAGGLGLVLGGFAVRGATSLHHRVEYVGVDGVAVGSSQGTTDRVTWEVAHFTEVAYARRLVMAPGHAALPPSLPVVFSFHASDGRALLTVSDVTHGLVAWPWSSLALAAEVAWTRWRLAHALAAGAGRWPELTFPLRQGMLRVTEAELVVEVPEGGGRYERRACTAASEGGRLRVYVTEPQPRCVLDVAEADATDLRLLYLALSCPTLTELAAAADPGGHHPALVVPAASPRPPTNNRASLLAALLVPVALAVVGCGVLALVSLPRRQRLLVVDNPSLLPIAVRLDGASLGTIAAHSSRLLDVTEGNHHLASSWTDGGTEITFRVPPRRHLFDGWYALWPAAGDGEARYARITMTYGDDSRPRVEPVEPVVDEEPLIRLDDPELAESFDEPFPQSASVQRGATTRVVRLCRVQHGMATGCGVE